MRVEVIDGEETQVTEAMDACAALIHRLHEDFSMVGGNLHVAVDDGNVDNASLAFCRDLVNEAKLSLFTGSTKGLDTHPPQVALEQQILDALDQLSESQREAVVALSDLLRVPPSVRQALADATAPPGPDPQAILRKLVGTGRPVQAGFDALQAATLSDVTDELLLQRLRSAFFAGATHVFTVVVELMGEDGEVTEEDGEIISRIGQELQGFLNEVLTQRAAEEGPNPFG